jgi:hypothetical protein
MSHGNATTLVHSWLRSQHTGARTQWQAVSLTAPKALTYLAHFSRNCCLVGVTSCKGGGHEA